MLRGAHPSVPSHALLVGVAEGVEGVGVSGGVSDAQHHVLRCVLPAFHRTTIGTSWSEAPKEDIKHECLMLPNTDGLNWDGGVHNVGHHSPLPRLLLVWQCRQQSFQAPARNETDLNVLGGKICHLNGARE